MIYHHLDRLLNVYRRVQTPDGSGGQVTVWAYVGDVWTMVPQPNAAERVQARQAGSAHDSNIYAAEESDVQRGDRLRDSVTAPEAVDVDKPPYWRVENVVGPSRPGEYLRAESELVQTEGAPWRKQ